MNWGPWAKSERLGPRHDTKGDKCENTNHGPQIQSRMRVSAMGVRGTVH